jgi:hypothetical protein
MVFGYMLKHLPSSGEKHLVETKRIGLVWEERSSRFQEETTLPPAILPIDWHPPEQAKSMEFRYRDAEGDYFELISQAIQLK